MRNKPRAETVEWGGIEWRRYPDSRHPNTARYFHRTRGSGTGGTLYLHRVAWEAANGPIPDGFCIHHADGNHGNNAPGNLECIPKAEHLRLHASEPERVAKSRESIKYAIAAAPAWHSSDEGRAWHRKHGADVWKDKPFFDHVCIVCGKHFATRTADASVCGANCFARQRRNSGIDDAGFDCPECGRKFTRNKYAKPGCCSRSCAARVKNRARGMRVCPVGG